MDLERIMLSEISQSEKYNKPVRPYISIYLYTYLSIYIYIKNFNPNYSQDSRSNTDRSIVEKMCFSLEKIKKRVLNSTFGLKYIHTNAEHK